MIKTHRSESSFDNATDSPEEKKDGYYFLENRRVRERMGRRMSMLIEQIHDQKIDCLVFLDKSARPLSWLFRECWKTRFPEEDIPMVKFVNIGNRNDFNLGYNELLDLFKSSQDDTFKVKQLVSKAEEGGEWLRPTNVGESWKNTLREDSKVFQQMRSVYGDSFVGKKVLIIDEYGYSGFSLMAALLSFNKTFSEAEWSATPFYEADITSDKYWIPWFGRQGVSGVLEIPDSPFLSGSLSKDSFERIGSAIDGLIAEETKKIKEKLPDYLQKLDELKEAIPYKPKISEQFLQRELRRVIDLQKEIVSEMGKLENLDDGLIRKNKENVQKIWEISMELRSRDKEKYKSMFDVSKKICFASFVEQMRPGEEFDSSVQGSVARVEYLKKIRATWTEDKLPKYQRENRKLRHDMKKLAQEISTTAK